MNFKQLKPYWVSFIGQRDSDDTWSYQSDGCAVCEYGESQEWGTRTSIARGRGVVQTNTDYPVSSNRLVIHYRR